MHASGTGAANPRRRPLGITDALQARWFRMCGRCTYVAKPAAFLRALCAFARAQALAWDIYIYIAIYSSPYVNESLRNGPLLKILLPSAAFLPPWVDPCKNPPCAHVRKYGAVWFRWFRIECVCAARVARPRIKLHMAQREREREGRTVNRQQTDKRGSMETKTVARPRILALLVWCGAKAPAHVA